MNFFKKVDKNRKEPLNPLQKKGIMMIVSFQRKTFLQRGQIDRIHFCNSSRVRFAKCYDKGLQGGR